MRRFSAAAIYSLALVLLLFGAGCSTIKSIYQTLDETENTRQGYAKDKSGLKKRVLLLPILNQAGLSEKRLGEVTSMLQSHLSKDPSLLLEKSTAPLPSTVAMRSPRYGIVMDTDTAKRAEETGANVLLTVITNSFEMRLKRVGIWPFRSMKREVEFSVTVNALDLTNGTLFLTRLESEKMDFGMDEIEDEEDMPSKPEMPEINDKTFTRVMSRIMDRQASAIKGALRTQPWTGRILSADGNKIVISAGRKAGLSKEKVFEVFNRGEQIRSASGGSIYLLGPKIGELKTTEIMEDFSIAQVVVGTGYKAGQVIKAKR